jgi:arsenate reductase (thioredoxin)
MTEKRRVLFLCTHNAARSQMAEALLRHVAGDRFEALSAGLEPTEVHSLSREVLKERGIPTAELRAKGVREFMGKVKVDYAIGVCDPAEVNCPRVFPFALQILQWPFEDPAAAPAESQLAAFRRVRDAIDRKVRAWVREVAVPR